VVGLGQGGEGGFKIFTDGQEREDHAALRHEAEAAGGHVLRAQARQNFAVHRDGAAGAGVDAGQRLEQRGLADADGAHDAGDFAGVCDKINAIEDLRSAVVQGQTFGFHHHPRPRQTSITA